MGYYSVLIILRVANSPHHYTYTWETVYFGEDENMMRVRFFDAARKAQTMPNAETVVVRYGFEELVRVRIEH
ncbi:MAG TPA: hypothetical protein VEL69_06270 [Ktedonobacteraceae bacterium]|nr:hypothetical protein [Ktedonobacteraceae bacterium]